MELTNNQNAASNASKKTPILLDGEVAKDLAGGELRIPSDKQKRSLKPRDLIRVGAVATLPNCETVPGEALLAEVISVNEDKIVAKIAVDTRYAKFHGVHKGDKIHLELRHILGIPDFSREDPAKADFLVHANTFTTISAELLAACSGAELPEGIMTLCPLTENHLLYVRPSEGRLQCLVAASHEPVAAERQVDESAAMTFGMPFTLLRRSSGEEILQAANRRINPESKVESGAPRAPRKPDTGLEDTVFTDGVERSRQSDRFDIPSDEEKAGLRVGDSVKVGVEGFKDPDVGFGGERFWVRLTNVDGDLFTGTVTNELFFTESHGISHGDELGFEARHILDVDPAE